MIRPVVKPILYKGTSINSINKKTSGEFKLSDNDKAMYVANNNMHKYNHISQNI